MIRYMNLIGTNARKALGHKINSKKKNKVLNDYAKLLDEKKKTYHLSKLKRY